MQNIKWLKIYAFITTIILLGLALLAFDNHKKNTFDTITVQRINVVEPDGKKEPKNEVFRKAEYLSHFCRLRPRR
jgi:hypothetical protein